QGVVDQLPDHQPGELLPRRPGLAAQAVDAAEGCPVHTLEHRSCPSISKNCPFRGPGRLAEKRPKSADFSTPSSRYVRPDRPRRREPGAGVGSSEATPGVAFAVMCGPSPGRSAPRSSYFGVSSAWTAATNAAHSGAEYNVFNARA